MCTQMAAIIAFSEMHNSLSRLEHQVMGEIHNITEVALECEPRPTQLAPEVICGVLGSSWMQKHLWI